MLPSQRMTLRTTALGARPFTIVYHHMQHVTDASLHAVTPSATGYRGNVHTTPVTIQSPTAVSYNPANKTLYFLSISQSSESTQLLAHTSAGAMQLLATLPGQAAGLVYDAATGDLYATSPYSPTSQYPSILRITKGGNVAAIAGGSSSGSTDGQGANASFTIPTGITLDVADGALYVSDAGAVRRVTTSGAVTTLASNVFHPGGPDGIVWNPKDGNFYGSDPWQLLIKKITPQGAVSTFAGRCVPRVLLPQGCVTLQRDGLGTAALFGEPMGITVDATGNLYVADEANNSIRKISSAADVSTLAGNGVPGSVDGAGLNAEFNFPLALTMTGQVLAEIESENYPTPGSLRKITTVGLAPPPPSTPILMFETPSFGSMPYAIASRTSANSALWYTDQTGQIAQLTTSGISTEFTYHIERDSPSPGDIVVSADGTPYFLDFSKGRLVHRLQNGSYKYLSLYISSSGNSGLHQLAYAPDGTLWIDNGGSALFTLTPSGTLTKVVYSQTLSAQAIAVAGDGSVWAATGFTIEKLDQSGNIIETLNVPADTVAASPDGNILFTEPDAIGEITISTGTVNVYPIYWQPPGCQYICSRGINSVTVGSDGAWWFTEAQRGYIGRLDINAGFAEYQVHVARSQPTDIVSGPDGNLWFVDAGAEKIGTLKLH